MKGQLDIIYLMAMMFAVVIAIAAGTYIFGKLYTSLDANSQFNTCAQCVYALSQGQSAQNNVANAIVILFLLAAFASVILAAFVDSHPIFLIVIIIVLPVEILISFIFHDAFFQIANQSFIGTQLANYPTISLLFQYLPVICMVLAIILAIVTFMK